MPEHGWVTAVVCYVNGHGGSVTFIGCIWNGSSGLIQSGSGVSAPSGGASVGGQSWITSPLSGVFLASGTGFYVGWTRASSASMEFSINTGGTGFVGTGPNPGTFTAGASIPGSIGAYIVYTPVGAPTANTSAASSVGSTTATLNGDTFPNGLQATWYYQWGTTTSYGNTTAGGTVGTNGGSTADTPESSNLTGLTTSTTYHFRLVASNAAGTTYGSDQSFTTNGLPNAPTLTAPANNASISLWQAGGTFTWTYNTGGAGGGQTAYALQIQFPSTGFHQFDVPVSNWWNGSAFQATEIFITSAAGSVTIGAANWSSIQPTYQWTVATKDANGQGPYASLLTVNNELPPYAPTLTAPASASYADLSGTPTFTWTYGPSNGLGGQTNFAIRRKISGAGTYSYYNVGSLSWQSTIVWNTGTAGSFTFAAASWTNGNTYNWSIATQDAGGQGPFAADFTIVAQAPPTVTVTAPTGTTTQLRPVVTWTAGFPAGGVETAYQIRTFTAAQYGAGGFNPATSPAVDDSGQVNSSALLYSIATTLVPGTYRAYANVTETGGETNGFNAFSGFITAVNTPNAPTLTATATVDGVTGCPMIQLQAQCEINLLSAVDSSFENGFGTFVGTNCTITQTAAQFIDGSFAMSMQASSAATMTALSGNSAYAVSGSVQYTAIASLRTAVTARSVQVGIAWYDSSHVIISTTYGTSAADTNSGWTQVSYTVVSPSNAAFAAVTIQVLSPANSEIHYVDNVGLFPGANTAWSLGGFLATAGVIITRSDGVYVRLASLASPALLSANPASQLVTVNDYEVTPLKAYTYTAIIQATGATGVVTSPASAPAGASVSTTQWWEFDPLAPSGAINAQPILFNPSNTEQAAGHLLLGQPTQNIVAYAMMSTDMTATIETFSATIYANFLALALSQRTIFFSSPFGASYYFRIAPGTKAHDTQILPSTSSGPHQTLAITGIAQPRPAV